MNDRDTTRISGDRPPLPIDFALPREQGDPELIPGHQWATNREWRQHRDEAAPLRRHEPEGAMADD